MASVSVIFYLACEVMGRYLFYVVLDMVNVRKTTSVMSQWIAGRLSEVDWSVRFTVPRCVQASIQKRSPDIPQEEVFRSVV